jgi:transposase
VHDRAASVIDPRRVCSKPPFLEQRAYCSASPLLRESDSSKSSELSRTVRPHLRTAISSVAETRQITRCSVDKNAFKLARVTVEQHYAAKV